MAANLELSPSNYIDNYFIDYCDLLEFFIGVFHSAALQYYAVLGVVRSIIVFIVFHYLLYSSLLFIYCSIVFRFTSLFATVSCYWNKVSGLTASIGTNQGWIQSATTVNCQVNRGLWTRFWSVHLDSWRRSRTSGGRYWRHSSFCSHVSNALVIQAMSESEHGNSPPALRRNPTPSLKKVKNEALTLSGKISLVISKVKKLWVLIDEARDAGDSALLSEKQMELLAHRDDLRLLYTEFKVLRSNDQWNVFDTTEYQSLLVILISY